MRLQLIGGDEIVYQLLDQGFHGAEQPLVGIEHGELAGTNAANDGLARQKGFQPLREQLHQVVDLRIADSVIDLLEAVDVDVEQIDRFAGLQCLRGGFRHLADHRMLGQRSGQLVEIGFGKHIVGRFIDAGEERHRGHGGGQRAQSGNDGRDSVDGEFSQSVADAELKPPQAQHEAAQAGGGDGYQPEKWRSARIFVGGHTQVPNLPDVLTAFPLK